MSTPLVPTDEFGDGYHTDNKFLTIIRDQVRMHTPARGTPPDIILTVYQLSIFLAVIDKLREEVRQARLYISTVDEIRRLLGGVDIEDLAEEVRIIRDEKAG